MSSTFGLSNISVFHLPNVVWTLVRIPSGRAISVAGTSSAAVGTAGTECYTHIYLLLPQECLEWSMGGAAAGVGVGVG